jgi:hypothetical protein
VQQNCAEHGTFGFEIMRKCPLGDCGVRHVWES